MDILESFNEKRKNIVETAMEAASGQGMAAALNCTSFVSNKIQLQPLLAAASPCFWQAAVIRGSCNLQNAVMCTPPVVSCSILSASVQMVSVCI